MIKAIIVDDEKHCADRIKLLLGKYTGTIALIGSYTTIGEAKGAIESMAPDVVFLDVHLNEDTGFDLLRQLKLINFEIIFTTAYDSYALDAFKFSALDYLLKPIHGEDFDITMARLKERTGLKDTSKKIEVLFHNFGNKISRLKKIVIPTLEGLTFINASEIVRCQSDGNCTDIFYGKGKRITATKTLKHFEEILGEDLFFRVHKSHFINMSCIDKYFKGKGGYVLMQDGAHIEVAVRRKEEFLRKLKDMD
ncbi:MAG: response regulator [Bacteroidota bacterium]